MPLVSVVIPTFERRPLLLQAAESVRLQTMGDWELLVADDGSTDGSAEALEALEDPRIRVLRLAHSGRPSVARNAGARAAGGRWIAFLDSDDVWLPRKLEAQLAAQDAAGVRWSYTGLELMDDAGRPVPFRAGGFVSRSGRVLRELLTNEAGATMSTLMVERALLDEVGGLDEGLHRRDDLDLVLRLAAREPVVAVDETLALLREHAGRSTAGTDGPHELTLRVYERFLARERDPALRRAAFEQCARLMVEGARYEAARGRYRRAAGMLRHCLRYDPPPAPWLGAAARIALRRLGIR